MILIDVFTYNNKLYTWHKDGSKNIFKNQNFQPIIYFHTFNETFARKVLKDQIIKSTIKLHLTKGPLKVLKITFNSINDFYNFKNLQRPLRNVGDFYNADLPIPEMYLFQNDLYPLHNNDKITDYEYEIPELNIARIKLTDGIYLNDTLLSLNQFKEEYHKLDPDIIFLNGKTQDLLKLNIPLNRIGSQPLNRIKGNSYFSYGQSYYRETPIYLRGRLLLKPNSMMDDFNLYSILEGSRICRMTIQRTSSHSIGAAITNLLNYTAYKKNYLIPYKVGIYEQPKPFRNLIKVDRGAYTLEPIVGIHNNVIELDFISMYPSIISKYNLSPETYNCKCHKKPIPQTDYHFCTKKGIVPTVCDFLIDRRLHFKKSNDHVSISKTGYLKWLLVVIFGFQAFKNKKIGSIEVHESINAIARLTLFKAIRIAEKHNYKVLHGIVDSLFVQGNPNIKPLINELVQTLKLPIEKKRMYKIMTFLPSTNYDYRPVSTAYYGISHEGHIKVRGIELRQRSAPQIVKSLQNEIIQNIDQPLNILKNHIKALDTATVDDLSIKTTIHKKSYKVNCPQKILKHNKKPGQSIEYIIANTGYVLKENYQNNFSKTKYKELLIKATKRLFPHDLNIEGQTTLLDFNKITIKN